MWFGAPGFLKACQIIWFTSLSSLIIFAQKTYCPSTSNSVMGHTQKLLAQPWHCLYVLAGLPSQCDRWFCNYHLSQSPSEKKVVNQQWGSFYLLIPHSLPRQDIPMSWIGILSHVLLIQRTRYRFLTNLRDSTGTLAGLTWKGCWDDTCCQDLHYWLSSWPIVEIRKHGEAWGAAGINFLFNQSRVVFNVTCCKGHMRDLITETCSWNINTYASSGMREMVTIEHLWRAGRAGAIFSTAILSGGIH